MSVIVLCALIGLFVGGVRGLLIAAAIGYGASWVLRNVLGKRLMLVQAQFLDSTFAVMGALCKADGAVSRDEIQLAESMFARLNLSSEQRQSAMAAFSRGKAPSFDLDAEVAKFARVSRGHRSLLAMFLQIQCAAAVADSNVHPAEHQMLVRVARGLSLSEADVAQLEALLRTGAPSPSPQHKLEGHQLVTPLHFEMHVTAQARDTPPLDESVAILSRVALQMRPARLAELTSSFAATRVGGIAGGTDGHGLGSGPN